ncbi:MAG: ABC transporter permease, partial [Desulfobacterales bacterium]
MAETASTAVPKTADGKPGIFRRIQNGLAFLFASKIAVVGLVMVMFWIIVAIFAPVFTPYTPLEQD